MTKPTLLSVVTLPDPTLRAPTHKVGRFDDSLATLVQAMRLTMHAAEGIGLAAPQIGQSLKLAVIEYEPLEVSDASEIAQPAIPFIVIINPTITHMNTEFEIYDEGCLSVPELQTPVPRATEISVLADTLAGERVRIRAKGLLARILQHEIDHLHGLLIVDRTTDRKVRKNFSENHKFQPPNPK